MKIILRTDDIKFLESLANRLSEALYAQSIKRAYPKDAPPFLGHDDYDRLRKLATEAKVNAWEDQHRDG